MNTEESMNAVQLVSPIKVEKNMQVLRSLQQREKQLVHALALCHEVVHELEAIHKSINIVLSILLAKPLAEQGSATNSVPRLSLTQPSSLREFPQETQNNKSDSDSEPDITQENRDSPQAFGVAKFPSEMLGSATNSVPRLSLTQPQIEPALQSLPKSKSLSNKSKFLNDEQRKKVLDYITDSKEQEAIKALPSHKRVSYIQKQLREKYNINLSFYHASNIIKEYIL